MSMTSIPIFTGLALTGFGGAIGAMARYGLGEMCKKIIGGSYPWATFGANVLGGLCMGLLMGYLAARAAPQTDLNAGAENLRLLLGVGVLGGFTTFSSFSLETFRMIENKAYGLAGGYMLSSIVCCVAAVWIGFVLIRFVMTNA